MITTRCLKAIHHVVLLARYTAGTTPDLKKVAVLLEDTEQLIGLAISQTDGEETFRSYLVSLGKKFPDFAGLPGNFDTEQNQSEIPDLVRQMVAINGLVISAHSIALAGVDAKKVARLLDDTEYLVALLFSPGNNMELFRTYLLDVGKKYPELSAVADQYEQSGDT